MQLDASGNATIIPAQIDNGSSDACGVNLSLNIKSFDFTNIGANTVTLTVTDDNSNSSTCTSTVTIQDNVDPIAVCQDIIIQLDASGNVSIISGDINNGSTDACGIASLSIDKTSFNCSNIGSNAVTLTVTDNNGNVSTCTSTVIVQDNIDPVANCQNMTIQLDATGNVSILDTDINNGSSDNCGVASLSLSKYNFTCSDLGLNTVTLTVTDDNGNISTCDATVTVQDLINPTANCKDFTVSLDRSGNAIVVPANIDFGSNDNCSISLKISKTELSGYANTLEYDCTDSSGQLIWLEVTDAAGLKATCPSTLTILDDQGPTVDDLNDRNVNTDNAICSYQHLDDSWNPIDNCGTVSSMSYSLSGVTAGTGNTLNGVVFNKGTTTVTWTASDNHGNNDRITSFDVVVSDDQIPVFTSCPDNISKLVSVDGNTDLLIKDILVSTYTDNCDVIQFHWELTGATTGTGTVKAPASGATNPLNKANSNTGTRFNIGTTTVNYTVFDAAGNSKLCAFTITVNASGGSILASKASVETSENQTFEEFTVSLKSAPTGTVVIDVASNNEDEGTVDKAQLTFNASNWDDAQKVRVTGVNDDVDDDNIDYNITLSINKAGTYDYSGYEQAEATFVTAKKPR